MLVCEDIKRLVCEDTDQRRERTQTREKDQGNVISPTEVCVLTDLT